MIETSCSLVLLADRHHGLRDSIRGLLETEFEAVFMVADEKSLLEGVSRLKPPITIVEMALAGSDMRGLLKRIIDHSPRTKILILTVHDEPTVAAAALSAGADCVVLKRNLAQDLLPALQLLRASEPNESCE
jgi:DNA-binding NarL/FixJ family response regulator